MRFATAARFVPLGLKRPLGALAGALLVAAFLLAAFADVVAPQDPIAQDIPNRLAPPGSESLFGTDNFGRDVLSRVIHGFRAALAVGVASVLVGTAVGVVIGGASAYLGGWVDLTTQRAVDAFLGFPFLVLAVVIVAALGASAPTVVFAISVALAPHVVRLTRASALSVTGRPHVMAARAIGAGTPRILLKHILPHSLGPVLAYATGFVGTALVAESSLSFLGLGVPPPSPSWGGMLQEGRQFLEMAPWLVIFPAVALSTTALSFVFVGDLLRDVLDPRVAPRRSRHGSP